MSAVVSASAAACAAAMAVLATGRAVGRRPPNVLRGARRPASAFARHPLVRRVAMRLDRAGIPIGAAAFIAAAASGTLAASGLAFAALRTPVAGVVAGAAVLGAAGAILGSAERRHRARIEAQLPGVAAQLAAALAAGLSLRQALRRAAADAPTPTREELLRVVAELDLGARIESALEGLAGRVGVHDLRIMVTAILVQRRTGGNLARALATLSGRLDERAQLARELRGATAQARMTAWMVGLLPLGGGIVTELAAPGTLARSFGSGPGPALLLLATTLYGLGVVAIRRVGRVER